MANKKELEVGDKVCMVLRGQIRYSVQIKRVTKTTAISEDGKHRFKRKIIFDNIKEIGKYNQFEWQLETQEVIEKDKRVRLVEGIASTALSDLQTNTLEEIYRLILCDLEITNPF